MNSYSLALILRPDLSEGSIKEFLLGIKGFIEKEGGEWKEAEEWGKRALAYPIKKQNEGYYFFLHFRSNPDLIKNLQKEINLKKEVIRSMLEKVKEKGEKSGRETAEAESLGEQKQKELTKTNASVIETAL